MAEGGITLALEALDQFDTFWEMRVVRAAIEHARPGRKLSVSQIAKATGGDAKQIKRGLAKALERGTLVRVPLPGKSTICTYAPGPRLAGLVWGQNVPESDNQLGTDRPQTLSDSGTKRPQKDELGTDRPQTVQGQIVPESAPQPTRAMVLEPPKKNRSKQETAKYQGNGSEKNRNGANAPPAAPDASPEDEALERFTLWFAEQDQAYVDLFEYVAPAIGAPWRKTDAKKRAQAASVVRFILAQGATVEQFNAARRRYKADPWRDKHTDREIPLNATILRREWGKLTAPDEPPEADDARDPLRLVEVPLTPAQQLARQKLARLRAEKAARNGNEPRLLSNGH